MISARTHYAALALIELARHQERPNPVAAGEITTKHGIPGPFLVQILRTLRSEGWVQSTRGSQGGYRLSIDPTKLTLLDIADAIAGQDNGCQSESKPTPADQALHRTWDMAVDASRSVLAQTRLADLVAATTLDEEAMFYI